MRPGRVAGDGQLRIAKLQFPKVLAGSIATKIWSTSFGKASPASSAGSGSGIGVLSRKPSTIFSATSRNLRSGSWSHACPALSFPKVQ
jgi:hypothetical protein